VVLKENPQSIVEKQQFKRKELSSIHRLKSSSELFFSYRVTFRRISVGVKNDVAHKWCKAEKSVEG